MKTCEKFLERRFKHGIKEKEQLTEQQKIFQLVNFLCLPQLILIDGGVGQVNIVLQVMKELNLDIPVCGMVKNDKHQTRGLIYNGTEIELSNMNIFRLVSAVQDEAHRFAIDYHKSLRKTNSIASELDEVVGIGPAKKKALFKKFGNIKSIKDATVEQLAEVDGINLKTAEILYNFFRK